MKTEQNDKPYTIQYPDEMDHWEWEDALTKGGVAARVVFDRDRQVEMTFLSLRRFVNAVEAEDKYGIPCYYVKDLVVLKEITQSKVEDAVHYLFNSGYFNDLLKHEKK